VQPALTAAIETWPRSSTPETLRRGCFALPRTTSRAKPRRSARDAELDAQHSSDNEPRTESDVQAFLTGYLRDDTLRMLFARCDDAIPVESQLVNESCSSSASHGQHEAAFCSLGNGHVAFMLARQLARDGKPESGPVRLRAGKRRSVEGFENALPLVRRDPRTFITNVKSDGFRCFGFDPNHAASGRVTDRVIQ